MIVFNNTKVIHARILFKNETGAVIEVFLLEPFAMDITTALQQHKALKIKCFID